MKPRWSLTHSGGIQKLKSISRVPGWLRHLTNEPPRCPCMGFYYCTIINNNNSIMVKRLRIVLWLRAKTLEPDFLGSNSVLSFISWMILDKIFYLILLIYTMGISHRDDMTVKWASTCKMLLAAPDKQKVVYIFAIIVGSILIIICHRN